MLSHLFKAKSNHNRVNKYIPYQNSLNMKGIDYPVKIDQINKFENHNDVSVSVHGYDKLEETVYPLRVTKVEKNNHVNLLQFSNGIANHYCSITNFSRLVGQTKNHSSKLFCRFCLHGFDSRYSDQEKLKEHVSNCALLGKPQKVVFPKDTHTILKNIRKQLKHTFVVYADLEALLRPMRKNKSNVIFYQSH